MEVWKRMRVKITKKMQAREEEDERRMPNQI